MMISVEVLIGATNGQNFYDLGYLVGQIAFYVLLVIALVAFGVWLWRRRR